MILVDLSNTVVCPFSVYLSAPCVPIKVFFYLLKLHYEFEAVRHDAAILVVSSPLSVVVQDLNHFQNHDLVLPLRPQPVGFHTD